LYAGLNFAVGKRFGSLLRNAMARLPRDAILLLDNCRIHHTNDCTLAMEEVGREYLFLAPYSPDMQPIELFFNKIKLGCKNYPNEPLLRSIILAIGEVTRENLQSWYDRAATFWAGTQF
jgi:transposase